MDLKYILNNILHTSMLSDDQDVFINELTIFSRIESLSIFIFVQEINEKFMNWSILGQLADPLFVKTLTI